MIVDDLAAVTPYAHALLKGVHCLRVPWHIWPEERTEYTWTDRELVHAEKLCPRDEFNQHHAITWKEIRLPYQQLIIASTFNDPCVWLVESKQHSEERATIGVTVFIRLARGKWACVPFVFFRCDDGHLATSSWRDILSLDRRAYVDWYTRNMRVCGIPTHNIDVDGILKMWDMMDGEHEPSIDMNNVGIILTAIVAVLSCKNVEQEVVEPPRKLQHARSKRGQLPLYRYHVLKVGVAGHVNGRSTGGHGEAVALHWVRGHFKRYSETNKLFGKYTGLYWWQPHIAGNAARVVEKDYELMVSP